MKKLDFGEKLIEIRKVKGLTQEDVAEKCNLTVRTIQRIESGSVSPRAYTIKIITQTLGFEFIDNSNTGYEIVEKDNNELKIHTILWYVKDLFNLKTNTMKKISILSSTTLIIVLSLFTFNSIILGQTPSRKNSITVFKNSDNSLKRIEVRFSNSLTYDSLMNIKKIVESYNIKINYKRMDFDDNNRLIEIKCEADTKKLGSGMFQMRFLDTITIGGFYCDYSKDAEIPFCIGGCHL